MLANATGLRSEVLKRLQVNSFAEGPQTPEGHRTMVFGIGNMKNLPAKLSKVDAALFRQMLVSADDADWCPITALERQFALLRDAPTSSEVGQNWLFHSVRASSNTLSVHPTTDEVYDGLPIGSLHSWSAVDV